MLCATAETLNHKYNILFICSLGGRFWNCLDTVRCYVSELKILSVLWSLCFCAWRTKIIGRSTRISSILLPNKPPVVGRIVSLPKDSWALVPANAILFWKEGLCRCKRRWGHTVLKGATRPVGVIRIRRATEPRTHTKRPHEDGGREGSHVSTSQGMRIFQQLPEDRESRKVSSLEHQSWSMVLPTPWFWTSPFRDSEGIDSTGFVAMRHGSLGNQYVTPKLMDLKQQQFLVSHDSVGWHFGLGSVGPFCWSCCGHWCGCHYLMAWLKWNVCDSLTHKFGALVLLSLFTRSLSSRSPARYSFWGPGSFLRGGEWKPQGSWRLILELIRHSSYHIGWFKQVTRPTSFSGWGDRPTLSMGGGVVCLAVLVFYSTEESKQSYSALNSMDFSRRSCHSLLTSQYPFYWLGNWEQI